MQLLFYEVGYFYQCETETLAIDTSWTILNISWCFSDEDPVYCCHWNDMSYPANLIFSVVKILCVVTTQEVTRAGKIKIRKIRILIYVNFKLFCSVFMDPSNTILNYIT